MISKAKVACEISGHPILDHFVDVNKMVNLGSGSQREVDDLLSSPRRVWEREIRLESLPAAEDLKKVERRITSQNKKSLKNPESLES